LTKPGIAGFVMITAGASAHVASGGRPDLWVMIHTVLGTGLATGGALALNQYVERDLDAQMRRTRNRPIPSGRIGPGPALAFGLALLAVGIVWLFATVGMAPAGFTALSAAAYILLYTPLKRKSYLATLVGAVPGALPALIGWTAAGGAPTLGAWVLFGIFFLWQLPHVLALAWLLKEDYQRVGFFLAPPSDPDGRRIGRHMVYHSISLLLVSSAPTFLGLTGWIYGVGAVALSAGMLATCSVAATDMSFPRVKRVFFASLLYQPLLLGLLLIDTRPLP
jgi:protoheme IX farnesyltransferase